MDRYAGYAYGERESIPPEIYRRMILTLRSDFNFSSFLLVRNNAANDSSS